MQPNIPGTYGMPLGIFPTLGICVRVLAVSGGFSRSFSPFFSLPRSSFCFALAFPTGPPLSHHRHLEDRSERFPYGGLPLKMSKWCTSSCQPGKKNGSSNIISKQIHLLKQQTSEPRIRASKSGNVRVPWETVRQTAGSVEIPAETNREPTGRGCPPKKLIVVP